MIKRTIAVTVLLFVMYALFVRFMAPVWWSASQHQWQDNVIKAEKFVYGKSNSCDRVIVGSSLSCRLIMDSLPRTYNLSFAGQSIYDGLSILNHADQIPETVFIEMNVALKKESEDFTSVVNSPVLYYPKKIIPALRNDKQPLGVVGAQLNKRLVRKNLVKLKSVLHLDPQNDKKKKEKKDLLFQKLLQLKLDSYSEAPDPVSLNESFSILKKEVDALKRKGAKVVFFEMPVNYRLSHLQRPVAIREAFYRNFSPGEYEYIPLPEAPTYETTDGVHLNSEEERIYTAYLRSKMKKWLDH